MKRLNTDSTTSDVGLVFQHKHVDFLQDKTEESLIHAIYSQIGSANTAAVVLYGCVSTFSTTTDPDDTLTITAGAVSYLGKTYEVDASAAVKTGANVHLLKLSTITHDASDPSLFTDNVSRDVQEIHKAEIGQGATGSGISDWDDAIVLQAIPRKAASIINQADTTKSIYTAVVDIGAWDMTALLSINVSYPSGVTNSNIVNINAIIAGDAGVNFRPLSDFGAEGNIQCVTSHITLTRGSVFTAGIDYNDPSLNRGKLMIQYMI